MKIRITKFGFSVVEILIAIGILVLILFGGGYGMKNILAVKAQLDLELAANVAFSNVMTILKDKTSWDKTIIGSADPSFRCFKDSANSNCLNSKGQMYLYRADGTLFMDPTVDGFDLTGDVCHGVGRPNCPLKLIVEWRAICSKSPCVNPNVRFIGKIERVNRENMKVVFDINWNRFSFDYVQGQEVNALSQSCAAVNGLIDQVTGNCNVRFGQLCPTGQIVQGIDQNMNIICSHFLAGKTCAKENEVAVGITSDGNFICKEIPKNNNVNQLPCPGN